MTWSPGSILWLLTVKHAGTVKITKVLGESFKNTKCCGNLILVIRWYCLWKTFTSHVESAKPWKFCSLRWNCKPTFWFTISPNRAVTNTVQQEIFKWFNFWKFWILHINPICLIVLNYNPKTLVFKNFNLQKFPNVQ